MPNIRSFLFWALVAFLPAASNAQASSPGWIENLRLGGYVIVLRHGATTSDQSIDSMSRPNLPAERQLTSQGRAQAKSIGEAMRRLKIPVALVLTSSTARAVDTGTLLGVGEVSATADLAEGGPDTSADEDNRRAAAFRELVAQRPPAGNNVVVVSHKPNIVNAFGQAWSDVREGEASVFKPDGRGGYDLIVRIRADEWSALEGVSD